MKKTSSLEVKKPALAPEEMGRIRQVALMLLIDPQDRSLTSALFGPSMNRMINFVRRELTDLTNASGFWEDSAVHSATRERAALAVCRLNAVQPKLPKFSRDDESDVK